MPPSGVCGKELGICLSRIHVTQPPRSFQNPSSRNKSALDAPLTHQPSICSPAPPQPDHMPVFKARPRSTACSHGAGGGEGDRRVQVAVVCQERWVSQVRVWRRLFTPLRSAQHSAWHGAGPPPTFTAFTPLLRREQSQEPVPMAWARHWRTEGHGRPTLSIYTQKAEQIGSENCVWFL